MSIGIYLYIRLTKINIYYPDHDFFENKKNEVPLYNH
jgi:hypothetical protein